MPDADLILALGPFSGGPRSSLVIQVLLIIGILGITAWLFRTRGAKQLAVRRLLIIAFAMFAVAAVAFPSIMTRVANLVGVGRGSDLLLYATVVVLLGFLALQEARTKNTEKRTTYLARRIALDEAEQPIAYRSRSLSQGGTQDPV
ncbi:DUF2304 domain-containing protein [Brachybacterium hainanense]|uniref:DUF2304 domain-containing protein n=1 Tax=Brachybacterium hainanense TaxID=1541174 RepID=A0ABV6RGJ5_9MICO